MTIEKIEKTLTKFMKQPSTIKGIFAIIMGVSIMLFPEHAATTIPAWLMIYGMFEVGRNEDKRIKEVTKQDDE